jgi:hypothetical protein
MAPVGYIQSELDIKLLVLYIMDRVAAPIGFFTLIDLAMCDEGIDYFLLTRSITHLVETGHLSLVDELYSITEKGRRNSGICESSLPYSVRSKCDKRLHELNNTLRREAQVQGVVTSLPSGGYNVTLSLDDDTGNLFTLTVFSGSQERADDWVKRFKHAPESIYQSILEALSQEH